MALRPPTNRPRRWTIALRARAAPILALVMIRRPPRSTLFPYTTFPISVVAVSFFCRTRSSQITYQVNEILDANFGSPDQDGNAFFKEIKKDAVKNEVYKREVL